MEQIGWRLAIVGIAVVMIVRRVIVVMMVVIVTFMALMAQIGRLVFIAMGMNGIVTAMFVLAIFVMVMVVMFKRLVVVRLLGMGQIGTRALDHGTLDAVTMAAAARIAVARATAVGAVFAFLLGLAMGALVGFDQRLPISDRDLIVVWMNFAEGQEAVPVATIFDEGGLQ